MQAEMYVLMPTQDMVFLKMYIWLTGEHILSFAACAGNEDIISMLIDAGASTRVQDYRGMNYILFSEYYSINICLIF